MFWYCVKSDSKCFLINFIQFSWHQLQIILVGNALGKNCKHLPSKNIKFPVFTILVKKSHAITESLQNCNGTYTFWTYTFECVMNKINCMFLTIIKKKIKLNHDSNNSLVYCSVFIDNPSNYIFIRHKILFRHCRHLGIKNIIFWIKFMVEPFYFHQYLLWMWL